MDYRNAALFTRVVETGSFTAASVATGLPKSSVSRAIAKLERELGVRLLQRTTRKVAVTDAGTRFYEQVRRALAGLEEAEAVAREEGNEPQGTVRMTAPADAFTYGLGEAIAEFLRAYPRIRVELSLTSRVVDLVSEGFDLAVRAGTLPDSTLVARRVGDSNAGLFAAPSYLARRGRPRQLSDLAHHDFLLFRARTGRMSLRLSGPQGEESVDVKGPVSADNLPLLARMAAAGSGVAFLPTVLAAGPVGQGELEAVLPGYRLAGGGVYVVLPSSTFVPSRVAALRDFLVPFLSKQIASTERQCKERHGAGRKRRG